MKLPPMKDILETAGKRNITYDVYVIVSYETTLAAIQTGTKLGVPVIFITGTDCCDSMGGFGGTVDTVKRAMEATGCNIPAALHLDRYRICEECVQAIQTGHPSVMIDSLSLPFEENVALTKKVVDYAYCYGITVEGELGQLVGGGRKL